MLKVAGAGHVSQATGENEWYTPSEYIELAKQVMGRIDLDPASCELAQGTVKAKRYYTIEQDGLRQQWRGRVWMNPPYSKELCGLFIDKLINEINCGRVSHACVLVNNATDTMWCQKLLGISESVCFVSGRIRFIDKSGKPANSPLQGQLVAYYGPDARSFAESFGQVGICFIANYYAKIGR